MLIFPSQSNSQSDLITHLVVVVVLLLLLLLLFFFKLPLCPSGALNSLTQDQEVCTLQMELARRSSLMLGI